jgi:hypothetical protein
MKQANRRSTRTAAPRPGFEIAGGPDAGFAASARSRRRSVSPALGNLVDAL